MFILFKMENQSNSSSGDVNVSDYTPCCSLDFFSPLTCLLSFVFAFSGGNWSGQFFFPTSLKLPIGTSSREHRFYKAGKKKANKPTVTKTLDHFTGFPMGLRPLRGRDRKKSWVSKKHSGYCEICSAFQEMEMDDMIEVTVRATVTPDGEFDTWAL